MSSAVTATITKIEPSGRSLLMDSRYTLLSLDLIQTVNRIPSAEIVLADGDAATREFKISDADFFSPGNKIAISLRYEGDRDYPIFVGYVVKHGLQSNSRQSTLTLYLKDPAFKLTRGRNNAIFRERHEIAIIRDILQTKIDRDKSRGIDDLKIGTFNPATTSVVQKEMVQFYCSDWDFILSRAAANGLWVLVDKGTISVRSPESLSGKSIELEYGLDEIFEMEIEADAREGYPSIEALAWNSETQTMSQPRTVKNTGSDRAIVSAPYQLVSGAELDPKELQDWADARAGQNRLSLTRGRIRIPGRGDLQLGDILIARKFGRRFSGQTPISGIRHQLDEFGWQTDIQFGLSPAPFAPSEEVREAPASQLLPAVNGLQIGVVVKTSENPGDFKVRVKIPRLTVTSSPQPNAKKYEGKYEGEVWARLATLEAGLTADGGGGRGTMFRPEPGDEVILGFLDDDPRQAVILGALYGKKNKPPLPVSSDNPRRGIVTKENLKIIFDDQEKSIQLETPGKNQMILLDKKGISIVDENQNSFVMNADGIQISSEKDIAIKAKGNVIIKGGNIDVQ